MATYDLLTDDPTTYPTQVRTPDGSAPRNATTEAGPLQDLANRTAYLKAFTLGRVFTSLSNMVAVTDATSNGYALVVGYGWYTYSATTVETVASPFVLDATGMGSGQWISTLLLSVLNQDHPTWIRNSLIPSGTTAAMKALTVASVNDLFFVIGLGWYSYSATGTAQAPWIETATGIGSGVWVHESWISLLNGGSPAKLVDSVMKYPQMVMSAPVGSNAVNAFTINSITAVQVTDSSTNPLSFTTPTLALNDELDLNAGPFNVVFGSADSVLVQLRVNQNGVDTIYRQRIDNGTGSSMLPFVFPGISYLSNSATAVTIYLEAYNIGGGTQHMFSADSWPVSGTAAFMWLTYKVFRKF